MGALADKLRFGNSPRTFAAVDFDSRQLRVVLAEKSAGRTRVLKLAAVAMPEGIDVETGNGKLADLLGRTLKDMGASGAGLLMHLSRSQAVLKPLTLPPGTPPEQMASMVAFQMEKELPFHAEEAVVDFCIEDHHYDAAAAPEAPAGVDVLVGATRLPIVSRCRELAAGAGARLLRLGLRPYANLRCVEACTERGERESVLLVHLGGEEAEIDVIVGSSLAFSRAVTLKLPAATASAAERDAAVASLAMEVARSVQSYHAVQRGEKVDAALVAGGTGLEAALAEQLARRLGVTCELLDPSGALRLGEVPNASAFISTLGLAIAHASEEPPPFDFLNPKRPGVKKNIRKRTMIAVASALGVALIAMIAVGATEVGSATARLDGITKQYDASQATAKKLKKEIERVKRVEAWQSEGRDWLSHWATVSALLPSCNDAYVQSFKTLSEGVISFTINARESKIITDLGLRLTEAGYKFQPGRLATVNDPFGYTYAADVRITPTPQVKLDLASVRPPPRPVDDDSLNMWTKGSFGSGASSSTASSGSAPAPTGAGYVPRPAGTTPAGAGGGPPWRRPEGGAMGVRPLVRPAGAGAAPEAHPPEAKRAEGEARPMDQAALDKAKAELKANLDKNGDGKVDRTEIKRLFFSTTIQRLILQHFDTNQNGRLDEDEKKNVESVFSALKAEAEADGQ